MEKTCTKFSENKSIDEFRFVNKKLGKRSSWCKPCFSKYEKEKYATCPKRREKRAKADKERALKISKAVFQYKKSHSCVDCGENDPIVLEFDHVSDKIWNISDMIRLGFSLNNIFKEIEKCVIRCANCHRKRTAMQMGWYNNFRVEEAGSSVGFGSLQE